MHWGVCGWVGHTFEAPDSVSHAQYFSTDFSVNKDCVCMCKCSDVCIWPCSRLKLELPCWCALLTCMSECMQAPKILKEDRWSYRHLHSQSPEAHLHGRKPKLVEKHKQKKTSHTTTSNSRRHVSFNKLNSQPLNPECITTTTAGSQTSDHSWMCIHTHHHHHKTLCHDASKHLAHSVI